jgi:hypothetical protein
MDLVETLCLARAEAIEQSKDHERHRALRRRVGIEQCAGSHFDAQRFSEPAAIALQIGAR